MADENIEKLRLLHDAAEAQRQMWFTCAAFVRERAGKVYAQGGRDHDAELLRAVAQDMEKSDHFPRSQGYFRQIAHDLYLRMEQATVEPSEKPHDD